MSSDDDVVQTAVPEEGGATPLSGTPNYSNAQNFLSHMNTAVDPRTGDFTCAFSMPALEANALQGPTVQLGLAFSAQLADDLGFGTGWALTGLSSYDPESRVLSLATGEHFVASWDQGEFQFKDCKLVTFRMKRDASQSGIFWVTHKNGVVEKLSTLGGIAKIAVPLEIRSPEGRSVHLTYQATESPRLQYIRDAQGEIMNIARNGIIGAKITLFPRHTDKAEFNLTFSNRQLVSVSLPETDATWRLQYDTIAGMNYVRRVDLPMGGYETIDYKADGHKTLRGAPTATVPYAQVHVRVPGKNQPSITTRYAYSEKNYLGHQSGLDWSPNEDNLYKMPPVNGRDYLYDSTATMEMSVDGKVTKREVKCVFNRLHLQTRETTTQNGHILDKETVYHDDPNQTFANQKPYFQLPKQTRTTWSIAGQTPRVEEVTTDFDDWGNLIRQVDETGLIEEREYYPVDGADGCPADPYGFKRSLKTLRAIPMAGRAAGAGVIETQYRYHKIDSLFAGDPYFLVVSQEKKFAMEATPVLLSTVGNTYITDKTHAHFGRILRVLDIVNENRTATDYTYSLDAKVLTIDARITGFDNASRHSIEQQSLFNGMPVFEESEEGTTVAYEYDALGRVVREIASPDTPYVAVRLSAYTLGATSFTTHTDVTGTRSRVYLDGLGREIRSELEDVDVAPGTFRETWTRQYDAFGDVVSETSTDWVAGTARPTLTTQYAYDHWGQRNLVINPDGSRVITEANPLTLVEKSWMEDKDGNKTGSTVTHGNIFGKPDRIEYVRVDGTLEAEESFEYDGIGRCVSAKDRLGHETLYFYDHYDRLIKTTLPDRANVTTTYAEHSADELPVEIGIAHASLGTRFSVGQQTFDGLSRRKTYTVGGRTIRFGYKAGSLRPSSETTPLNQVINYEYEPALGMQLKTRTDVSASSYEYDKHHAQLTHTSRDGLEKTMEYFRSGQLKVEKWKNETDDERTASYTYSLAGRAQSYTNVFGVKQVVSYDNLGRPEKLQHEGIVCQLKRDGFGRVIEIKAWEGTHSMTTSIAYDDFGRERKRTFVAVAIGGATVSQELFLWYNAGGQLRQRVFKEAGENLRDERFAYDNRGHLVEYIGDGPQPPKDPWGKVIKKQVFDIDAVDRIRSITTTFPEGVNTTTYHYLEDDPVQLTRLVHSHKDYPQNAPDLQWDAAGRLISDERGRKLSWNAQNQLVEITAPTV